MCTQLCYAEIHDRFSLMFVQFYACICLQHGTASLEDCKGCSVLICDKSEEFKVDVPWRPFTAAPSVGPGVEMVIMTSHWSLSLCFRTCNMDGSKWFPDRSRTSCFSDSTCGLQVIHRCVSRDGQNCGFVRTLVVSLRDSTETGSILSSARRTWQKRDVEVHRSATYLLFLCTFQEQSHRTLGSSTPLLRELDGGFQESTPACVEFHPSKPHLRRFPRLWRIVVFLSGAAAEGVPVAV